MGMVRDLCGMRLRDWTFGMMETSSSELSLGRKFSVHD